uniref:Uncharacterized protein n=1 Tax=Rhizophora mucronata TaxID=61149 RepID=A0A2P2R486_RHIMU
MTLSFALECKLSQNNLEEWI